MPVAQSLKWLLGTRGACLAALAATVYAQPFRPLVFVGSSMHPTYRNGEMTLTVPAGAPLERGDVVVIERPDGPIVKRVVLLPGDPVLEVRSFGRWKKAFAMRPLMRPQNVKRFRFVPVPEGMVYVLGDNIGQSTDSRDFGPVPIASVTRKVYRARPAASARARDFESQARLGRTW
jgi:signal peptidase I